MGTKPEIEVVAQDEQEDERASEFAAVVLDAMESLEQYAAALGLLGRPAAKPTKYRQEAACRLAELMLLSIDTLAESLSVDEEDEGVDDRGEEE